MRSYKSAFPTWTTYTPYTGPLGVAPPIQGAPNYMGSSAHHWSPGTISGWLNRTAGAQAAMASGTTGQKAVGFLQHRPVTKLATEALLHRAEGTRRSWHSRMKESMMGATPEPAVEPEEVSPPVEGRTAPLPVDPGDISEHQMMQAFADQMVKASLGSPKAGTATLNMNRRPSGLLIPK